MTAAADTTERECREWLAREEHHEPIELTPRIRVGFLHSPSISSRTPGHWTAYAHDRAIMGGIIARADGATPEAAFEAVQDALRSLVSAACSALDAAREVTL